MTSGATTRPTTMSTPQRGQQPAEHGVGQTGCRNRPARRRATSAGTITACREPGREQLEQDVRHQVGGLVDVAERGGAEHGGHHQDPSEPADPRDQGERRDGGREPAERVVLDVRPAPVHRVGEPAPARSSAPARQEGVRSVAVP